MTESIGQHLKKARLAKKLTISKAAELTRIRIQYLEAIEADNFHVFPSIAQGRGFLRNYAIFLGLKLDDLLLQKRMPSPGQEEEKLVAQQPRSTPAPPEQGTADNIGGTEISLDSDDSIKGDPESMDRPQPGSIQESPATHSLLANKKRPGGSSRRKKTGSLLNKIDQDSPARIGNNSLTEEVTSKIPELQVPENDQGSSRSAGTSKGVFASIGRDLRQRRELLGMTLNEIEQQTHIRRHHLESLESGDTDQLPSSVQARGMINNYAHFLDMDAEALLLRFAGGLQAQLMERHPQTTKKSEKTASRSIFPDSIKRLLSIDLIAGIGFGLLFIVFVVWGANRVINPGNPIEPAQTAPSISDLLLVSPTSIDLPSTDSPAEAVTTFPMTLANTPGSAGSPVVSGRVNVIVVAIERAYVIVTVDGQTKFDGRVVPGTAYPFDGNDQIVVLTGNGAAIKITYNGVDLGTIGTYGQIVNLVFSPSEVMTPTPTASPTATASPLPSITPRPSSTPRFTPTQTP